MVERFSTTTRHASQVPCTAAPSALEGKGLVEVLARCDGVVSMEGALSDDVD